MTQRPATSLATMWQKRHDSREHATWLHGTIDDYPCFTNASMIAAQRDAANPAGLDPWSFGSATIGALKRCGFIVVRNGAAKPRRYELTEAGRSVLAKFGATTR